MLYYTDEKNGGVMMATKTDRRVSRTRKHIKDAFSQLLQTKDFEKITVTEIAETADINRRTFYLHYIDVFALLEELETDLTVNFQQKVANDQPQNLYQFQLVILDFLRQHKSLMIALLSNNASHFLAKVMEIALDAGFATSTFKLPEERQYWWNYIKHGMRYVLLDWLKTQRLTREHMAKLTTQLINQSSHPQSVRLEA